MILIGNYPADKQESMIRFAHLLHSGLTSSGLEAEIWWPTVFFGAKITAPNAGLDKWLGYLDKWLVFPVVLTWRLLRASRDVATHFHICDHSNAPYLKYLPSARTAITCHDVLAIRGSLGHADTHAPASALGKVLQKWILHHLSRAKLLAAVSDFTLDQLRELQPESLPSHKDWRVIHNSFNAKFEPLPLLEARRRLTQAGIDLPAVFILHVGSGHPRKNRRMLLQMVAVLGQRWDGSICFAGEAMDKELLAEAISLGLRERIVSVPGPSHAVLVALYSACQVFVFPSLSEGFGWPVIEAQACGTPVIASSTAPMPEVSGGAALHADPTSPQAFAEALLAVQDEQQRADLVQKALKNSHRFTPERMINAYLDLHSYKR